MVVVLRKRMLKTSVIAAVALAACGWSATGCGGPSFVGTATVDKRSYVRGSNVKVLVQVPKGAVGTYLRIQRWTRSGWREAANFNPKENCPVMKQREGGGYKFVTTRSPRCRRVKGSWLVYWQGTVAQQCRSQLPVLPGRYRICVVRYARRCQVREGVFGFERPRGASKFICTKSFRIR